MFDWLKLTWALAVRRRLVTPQSTPTIVLLTSCVRSQLTTLSCCTHRHTVCRCYFVEWVIVEVVLMLFRVLCWIQIAFKQMRDSQDIMQHVMQLTLSHCYQPCCSGFNLLQPQSWIKLLQMLTQHLLFHVKSFQLVKHTVVILVIFLMADHFSPCQVNLENSGEMKEREKLTTTLKPTSHCIKAAQSKWC